MFANSDVSVDGEELFKRFQGCRIVDAMAFVEPVLDPNDYNRPYASYEGFTLGCALRYDTESDPQEQTLLQYAWFVRLPNGRFVASDFVDGKELNGIVQDVRNGEKRRGLDPSLLVGEAMGQQAEVLKKLVSEEPEIPIVSANFNEWVQHRLPTKAEIKEGLEADTPIHNRIEQGLTYLNDVFKDIDTNKAKKYVRMCRPKGERLIKNAGLTSKELAVGLTDMAKAVATAGQEAMLTLSGPEVQAITRALLALEGRIQGISDSVVEKIKAVQEELAKKEDGVDFTAQNTIAGPDEEVSRKIAETKQIVDALEPGERGKIWDTYFDYLNEAQARQELTSENEQRALAAGLGLGADPMVAVETVVSLAQNDALVNQTIENALEQDLQMSPEAITQKILDERHKENEHRKLVAAKEGKKPVLLSRYTKEGFPIRAETLGPYVKARVQSERIEAINDCEHKLKEGLAPTANQLRLYTAKNLAGVSIVKTLLDREADPDLMSKAQHLVTQVPAQPEVVKTVVQKPTVQQDDIPYEKEKVRKTGHGRTLTRSKSGEH